MRNFVKINEEDLQYAEQFFDNEKHFNEWLAKVFNDFEERFEDLKLEFAATDSDGFIIRNEKGEYRFRKDDEKKLNRAFKSLRTETFIDMPSYIITDYDQTKEYPDSFKGFVI